MTRDFKRVLLHNLTAEYRAMGLSFVVANGVAIDEIERASGNGGFDWRSIWVATANDERILATMKRENAA